MRAAAGLARDRRVRLHTHVAETADEDEFCAERFGCTPVEYLDSLGWLADDVWLAHAVHLDDAAIARLAVTGTGVAHCRPPTPGWARGSAGRPTCSRPAFRSGSAWTAPPRTRRARCSARSARRC